MKRMLCLLAVFLLLGVCAFGQQRDSLIVEGLAVDYGSTFVSARIWAVVFDSIYSYNIPLRWNAPLGGINCIPPTRFFPPLTSWDMNSDSINNDLHIVTIFGNCNLDSLPNPPLYTYGQRINIITLRFSISHDAPPQVITVDTAGPIDFGYNPVFVSGQMRIIVIPAVDEDVSTPQIFSLNQNYPNPFNAQTLIQYNLAGESDVSLTVFDILGRQVETLIDGYQTAGPHQVIWNADNSPSGIYFYKLKAGDVVETKRMLLIR
jgi:hypothetical protein